MIALFPVNQWSHGAIVVIDLILDVVRRRRKRFEYVKTHTIDREKWNRITIKLNILGITGSNKTGLLFFTVSLRKIVIHPISDDTE